MTVKELKDLLLDVDEDRVVILSMDSEGNSYSPMSKSYGLNMYKDNEIGLEELTPRLEAMGYSDEDVLEEGEPSVVFYPV